MTCRRAPHRCLSPRRASQRTLPPRRPHDPILLLGTVLVLTLVALLPLALALMPTDGGTSEGADTAGIGSGVGELSAAALSALHRDLSARQTGSEDLPPPLKRARPPFLAAASYPHPRADTAHCSNHDPTRGRAVLVTETLPAPTGPGPDGSPLLL